MERINDWRDKVQCHISLTFPDGSTLGAWVHKGINVDDFIKRLLENWYFNTSKHPETHGHIILDEKCPICCEHLHAKEYEKEIYCWCVSCRHQEVRYKND